MKIGVISDSHFRFFENALFKNISFVTLVISGVSFFGINKDKSTTDSKNKVKSFIATNKDLDYILFGIGKVDLDFVFWYRKELYNLDINIQCNQIIEQIQKFITEVCSNSNIGFLLPSIPTVDDNYFSKLLEKYDSLIKYCDIDNTKYCKKNQLMSQINRTKLTLDLNKNIKKCIGDSYLYIDINDYIYNVETGVINTIYKLPEPIEHHLNPNTNNFWFIEIDKQLKFISKQDDLFKNGLYHINPNRYFEVFYTNSKYSIRQELINSIEKHTDIVNNKYKTLVDVGCGAGDFCIYFSKYFKVTGEDTAFKAIEKANNKKINNCKFICNSSLNEHSKHDIVFCKGPCFFNKPIDNQFINDLKYLLKRTQKTFIFCMYTKKPYDRRENNSWYHDPYKIKELLSHYGQIINFLCDTYFIIQVNPF